MPQDPFDINLQLYYPTVIQSRSIFASLSLYCSQLLKHVRSLWHRRHIMIIWLAEIVLYRRVHPKRCALIGWHFARQHLISSTKLGHFRSGADDTVQTGPNWPYTLWRQICC